MIDTDGDLLLLADPQKMLLEIKRLRKIWGKYVDFVLWVEKEHNEVFDQYERKDEL